MKKLSPEIKWLLIFMVPVAAFLILHYYMTGFVIYNDGRGYYMYLRSAVIDQDINFTNEWAYYNSENSSFSAQQRAINYPEQTKTGYLENIYLIGNAIMWAPFFLTSHLLSLMLNSAGLPLRVDGYGAMYELSVGIASMVYGFLGLCLIYKFCRKWFDRKVALLATITAWYGTAFFWYHSIEPSMSHMNSIFLISSFTYLWHNTLYKRTKLQWLFLGALLGMIFLVRQQEILMGMLPAFELIRKLTRTPSIEAVKKIALSCALLLAGILLVTFPQMLAWKEMFGSYIVFSYGGPATAEIFYFTTPQLIPMIISPEAGMWRVPAMLLSIIGLFFFARRVKGAAWYFLAAVVAQAIVISAWTGWNISYGIRYFLGMSIFFALGAAELIQRLRYRIGMKAIYAAIAILIAANFLNMLAVMLTEITSRVPLSEVIRLLIEKIS